MFVTAAVLFADGGTSLVLIARHHRLWRLAAPAAVAAVAAPAAVAMAATAANGN